MFCLVRVWGYDMRLTGTEKLPEKKAVHVTDCTQTHTLNTCNTGNVLTENTTVIISLPEGYKGNHGSKSLAPVL